MARILLIDDDRNLRSALRMGLELHGYTVVEAANGRQGVLSFQEEPADLVLCDMQMPVQGGLQTIQELRTAFPAVKIVAMSAGSLRSIPSLLPAAETVGANLTLQKPFRMAKLKEVVTELLHV